MADKNPCDSKPTAVQFVNESYGEVFLLPGPSIWVTLCEMKLHNFYSFVESDRHDTVLRQGVAT